MEQNVLDRLEKVEQELAVIRKALLEPALAEQVTKLRRDKQALYQALRWLMKFIVREPGLDGGTAERAKHRAEWEDEFKDAKECAVYALKREGCIMEFPGYEHVSPPPKD